MELQEMELSEWLNVLKPYQIEIVQNLVREYGAEEAIEKWVLANGPMNMVKFGGDSKNEVGNFTERYKKEINKFICGHSDYEEYRDEFEKINDSTKTVLVSGLSALIGSQLGVSGTILSPIIVLSLYLAGKMGINAYCSGLTIE